DAHGSPVTPYEGFEDGETISYNAEVEGANPDEGATLIIMVNDDPVEHSVGSMFGERQAGSGTFPVDGSTSLILFAVAPSDVPSSVSGFITCNPALPPASTEATLSSLSASPGSLDQEFSSETFAYNIDLEYDT